MWILSSLIRKHRKKKFKLTALVGGGGGGEGEAVEKSCNLVYYKLCNVIGGPSSHYENSVKINGGDKIIRDLY